MRENILVKREAWGRQPKVNLFRVGYRLIEKNTQKCAAAKRSGCYQASVCRRGHGKTLSVRVLIATEDQQVSQPCTRPGSQKTANWMNGLEK